MKEEYKNYVNLIREDNPMQIELIGETYCDSTFKIMRECSDLNALEFIIEGEGVLEIENQHLTPQTDDIFLLREGTHHSYFSDGKNPWHKYWIVFRGELADCLMNCYLPKDTYLFHGCSAIKKYFEEIVSLSKKDIPHEILVNKVTLCLVNIFMYIRSKELLSNEDLPEIIRTRLDESVENDFNLDELCKSINYSKNYVINVFKDKYGITPYKYFLDRKIDSAKVYLSHTNMSVYEISKVLHYSDQQYFSVSFKNSVGCSPMEYRRRTRGTV